MIGLAAVSATSESADKYLELIPFESFEDFKSQLKRSIMACDTISSFATCVIAVEDYTQNARLKHHIDIIAAEVLDLV